MKKKFCMVLFLFLFGVVPMVLQAAGAISVTIDDMQVAYTKIAGQPFIDASGRTQVPFRQTMETFGCTVSWDSDTNTAVAKKDGVVVKVPVGQSYIYRNNEKVQNDTAAMIVDDRTYLPIRVVLESFGASVSWQPETSTVVVSTKNVANHDGMVMVHFMDVGQGDATLIDDGDFEILIDGGLQSAGSHVVEYIKNYVDDDLDIVVATHEDADHIGGLSAVFDTYDVAKVIDNGRIAKTKIYQNYADKVAKERALYDTDDTTQTITMPSGAVFKTLSMKNAGDDANDNSVVTLLDYQDTEVLFTGDLSVNVAMANKHQFQDIDVWKAGHHGSRTSVNDTFLQLTSPENIVISAGRNNTYGHPHKEAMESYLKTNANVYATFCSGDIVMKTNGKTIQFENVTPLTMADVGAKTEQTNTDKTNTNHTIPKEAMYIGNRNSKIFHYADCASINKTKESNRMYFQNKEEALEQGYQSCKVCKP